jgi:hypothetical protein
LQFESAYAAMTTSSLTVRDVYAHYLNSGGSFDEFEFDAYLHGLVPFPRDERNCVAQAVNELIDDLAPLGRSCPILRASYSDRPSARRTDAMRGRARRLAG